jgi:hypothetical protein
MVDEHGKVEDSNRTEHQEHVTFMYSQYIVYRLYNINVDLIQVQV